MSYELGDETRLRHILESIEEVENATAGFDLDEFISNHVVRIAVVKWIEIIGEASVYLSDKIKNEYSETDWPAIKGLRNIVVHEYFGIKYDLIWEIASEHLPVLKKQVLKIIEEKF
jgi:uncharacterized protein with HEPN domain